jgi:hypothetical protein
MKRLPLALTIVVAILAGCDTPPLEDPIDTDHELHQCDVSVCAPTTISEAEREIEPSPLRDGDELPVEQPGMTVRTLPANEPQDTTAPSGRNGFATYTVTASDTGGYSGIAQRVYGQGRYWYIIANANPEITAAQLCPGMVIIIPPLPENAD